METRPKKEKEACTHYILSWKTHTQHTRMALIQPEPKVMLREAWDSSAFNVGCQTELYSTNTTKKTEEMKANAESLHFLAQLVYYSCSQ